MSLRCFVVFCSLIAVQSASIIKRNIPVEIVYDKFIPSNYGVRSLNEKVQLSQDDLLKLKISDEIINDGKDDVVNTEVDEIYDEPLGNLKGVKNLEEKNQLSPEEVGHALKYLPNTVEEIELTKSALYDETEKPAPTSTSGDSLSLLNKAEQIIYSGINTIKNNVDEAPETVAGVKPGQEAWEKLNATFENFFKDQYKKVDLKQGSANNTQNNQNNQVTDNVVNGFVSIFNNFMGTYFPQNNQQSNGTEDEQQGQSGPFQGFVNLISGGVNQVVSSVNNLNNQNSNQNSTGQEDTGVGEPPNIINNVISTVQQFFSGNQGNPSQSVNANQSDTGTETSTAGSPLGFFQGVLNNFNQVVNNVRPPQSPDQPSKPEDETTTASTNFFQNIGQALQNFNIIPQASTQAPGGGAGGAGGSNPISTGIQAVNNQIQQFVGNQTGGNPVESIQNAIGGATGSSTEKTKTENLQKDQDVTPQAVENEKESSEGKKETPEIMETTE